ncbi:hypothetical protein PoB_001749000 [Plakobranchus ocellatus]|uniref:Uncharacterized protein n=1 Tax=Plakobranchus ocellatus TaxID=259542 RepID=A0AAV3Z8U6_9GAST|nr:hypothetical protein PoB_001749000 [Plakobranchus ocellatus]
MQWWFKVTLISGTKKIAAHLADLQQFCYREGTAFRLKRNKELTFDSLRFSSDALDRKRDKASVLSARRKTFQHIIYRACPRALAFIASKRSFCAWLYEVLTAPSILSIFILCDSGYT